MVFDAFTIAGIILAAIAVIVVVQVCRAGGDNCMGKK